MSEYVVKVLSGTEAFLTDAIKNKVESIEHTAKHLLEQKSDLEKLKTEHSQVRDTIKLLKDIGEFHY